MAKGPGRRVTHKRLMQQNCIETLQSDRESLIQELSLFASEEIVAILWLLTEE